MVCLGGLQSLLSENHCSLDHALLHELALRAEGVLDLLLELLTLRFVALVHPFESLGRFLDRHRHALDPLGLLVRQFDEFL